MRIGNGKKLVSGLLCVTLIVGLDAVWVDSARADDTVAAATQDASAIQSVTGTADVIPTSQSTQDSDSAAVSQVSGGTVDVPKDPSSGVTLTTSEGQSVVIGVPQSSGSGDAVTTSAGTTVYDDPSSDSATGVQATTDGVRQLFVLNSADAATDVPVPLTLPAGSDVIPTDDGGYDIVEEDATQSFSYTVAHINAPWAVDNTGASLPTYYTYSDGTLIQHVDTTGAVFPVVADPRFTWGWVSGTLYFNKLETRYITVFSNIAALAASLTGVWSILLRTLVSMIATMAGIATAQGKCIEVKTYFAVHIYSGGYCT